MKTLSKKKKKKAVELIIFTLVYNENKVIVSDLNFLTLAVISKRKMETG